MKEKIKFILIGVAATIVTIVLISVIVSVIESSKYDGSSNEEDEYYYKNSEKIDLEMAKYGESKDYLLENGNILVEVSNNNDHAARGKIYVEFFDENNESIIILDNYISHIPVGKKSYEEIMIGEELKKVYKTYKVKVVLSYESSENDYYKDIKLISFDKKSGVVKFKNNSRKKLDSVDWGILYYDKDDNIIAYSTVNFWDVKSKKTVTKRAYLEDVSYDKVEIVLLEARKYY